jgi:hypothetical protein
MSDNKPVNLDDIVILKHDIKNQLSNILLAVEGLKFELEDKQDDVSLYIDSLSQSVKKIDLLLNRIKTDV